MKSSIIVLFNKCYYNDQIKEGQDTLDIQGEEKYTQKFGLKT
jgi:hypothetical protein